VPQERWTIDDFLSIVYRPSSIVKVNLFKTLRVKDSMKTTPEKIKEVTIDNKDQGTVFSQNRLSWQSIILTQEKWANTDNSWKSILILILLVLGIILVMSVILNSLYGL
jgi:hypothetical protein